MDRATTIKARSELEIEIDAGATSEGEELAELTQRLRNELLDFDVDSIHLARNAQAPEGAKAVDVVAVGTLIVHLVSRSEVLGSISAHVRDWLQRQRARSVKLTLDGDTLELTGVSSSEQDRLIELWVARHDASG